MRFRATNLALPAALLCLAGCGGGDDRVGSPGPPPQIVTHILSDPAYDGDIEETGPGTYTVTQGMSQSVQTVLAGIDPVSQDEFRAFLDFHLGGSGGVPLDAIIDSASVEFQVDGLSPQGGSLPVRVELVAFQPPNLLGTDFDRTIQPALAQVLVQGDVNGADVGHFVSVDVTPLMIEAQRRGLVDLQLRILEDLGPGILTLMSIDDATTTDRANRAPELTVLYH